MTNFYLIIAIIFVIAFIGQYRLKVLEGVQNVDIKKLRTLQVLTMTCFFTGGILCIVYLFNRFIVG